METKGYRFVWAGAVVALLLGAQRLSSAPRKPSPCTLRAKTVMSDSRHFTLVVEYPRHCEVAMDGDDKKIVLRIARSGGAIGRPIPKKKRTHSTNRSSSGTVEALIKQARVKVGSSYVYGATGPDHFDCSGFVYYLYKTEGIVIPRTSRAQSESGTQLLRDQLRRGDMVFFDTFNRGHVNHSGVYLGKGQFIHASSGKAYGVTISNLDKGFYQEKFRWGIRKIASEEPSTRKHAVNEKKQKVRPHSKQRNVTKKKRRRTSKKRQKQTKKMTLSEGINRLFDRKR
jgi:hypothetical protein